MNCAVCRRPVDESAAPIVAALVCADRPACRHVLLERMAGPPRWIPSRQVAQALAAGVLLGVVISGLGHCGRREPEPAREIVRR